MIFPNFIGPAYRSQSPIVDGERLVNWYLESTEVPGAKAAQVFYPCPGFTSFTSFPNGNPCRENGLFDALGRLFAGAFDTLYEVTDAGLVTSRGTFMTSGNPMTWAINGVDTGELFFCSGTSGYLYNLTTNVLTNPVNNIQQVGFMDGYFIGLDPLTGSFRISDLFTGGTWPAGQIAFRTLGPDRWVSLLIVHGEIWLFGTLTTEVWYNAGTSPFPFAVIPNSFMEVGIDAPYSAAVLDQTPIWLARTKDGAGIVVRADGYSPRRVSTHAIEYAIQGYARTDDARGSVYQQQGHSFYELTFPTAGHTWVFDATTEQWHERGYWDNASNSFLAYRPNAHVYAFGRHLVGDRQSASMFSMSPAVSTEMDGNGIRRVRRCPHLSSEEVRLFFKRMQIDLETGIGLSSGQGSNPQIMLRWSDDGGQTFGNEHWVTAGAQGRYKTRAIWNILGSARDRVFEVVVSDPVPYRLVGAYLDVEKGLH